MNEEINSLKEEKFLKVLLDPLNSQGQHKDLEIFMWVKMNKEHNFS